jgi:hypothetical protein
MSSPFSFGPSVRQTRTGPRQATRAASFLRSRKTFPGGGITPRTFGRGTLIVAMTAIAKPPGSQPVRMFKGGQTVSASQIHAKIVTAPTKTPAGKLAE